MSERKPIKDLKIDPDNTYVIETSGALDSALTGVHPAAAELGPDHIAVREAIMDVRNKALAEGRSVRINGDLVTISLDAYKQLSADAERGRWRISAEEPPPLEDRIHCKDANGFVSTRRIALCDLPNIAAWRPLD